MRRPRTVNGYSINDVLSRYKYVDKDDDKFWDAAYKFFGQDQMASMRVINLNYHYDLLWEAKEHCAQHGGCWTEEDEGEEFMAALWGIGGNVTQDSTGFPFLPISNFLGDGPHNDDEQGGY